MNVIMMVALLSVVLTLATVCSLDHTALPNNYENYVVFQNIYLTINCKMPLIILYRP